MVSTLYINKKNKFALIMFFVSYYLFFLSLEKCYEGEDRCCKKWKWIKKKLNQETISCIIISILFELIILKILSIFHFLHFIVVFIGFYRYSHGILFDDHGDYNFFGLYIIVLSFLAIMLPFDLIYYSKNKTSIIFYILLLLFILYLIYFMIINKYIKCDDWDKGLNNTYIDNNIEKYGCQIKIPKDCPYKIGQYFLDKTKIFGLKCLNLTGKTKDNLLKASKSPYINNNTKIFAYPLMNNDKIWLESDNGKKVARHFLNTLIDAENITQMNDIKLNKTEIKVDFTDTPYGELIIDINFNETLSKERKKLEQFNKPYSDNIMIIYLDSVSRALSLRQLKKTLKFFEKFMSYKGYQNHKFPSENYHSFQFFKYYSHKFYTVGNYPIIYYGNLINKKNVHINTYLKENGYITSFTSGQCGKDWVRSYHIFTNKDNYDHKFITCDPNVQSKRHSLKCLYNKHLSSHYFEYTEQFWRKYKNNRKFATVLTNDAHEGSLEMLKNVDDITYNFFNSLFKDNLLKDSTVFLLSDHGVSIPSIYYLNDFFKYEKELPMLYILINDRKNLSYEVQYKNIFENQQVFITGFDIYNTIGHLIYGDQYEKIKNKTKIKDTLKSKKGISLFNKINAKIRSPKIYFPMDKETCV